MRALVLLGVSALALSACHVSVGRHGSRTDSTRVVARLTCPERQGDLLRSTASADGRSCSYTAPSGGEVTLRLVSLTDGGAEPTLAPLEASLRTIVPPPAPRPAVGPHPVAVGDEDVDIDMPFFHVRTRGDNAQVRMPGISVDAQDDDAQVNVSGRRGEQVRVNARGGASEVRVNHNGRDLRYTYTLSREEPTADGWRLAGYQARGPRTGPLVVATVRSRADSHSLMSQIDDLVGASFRGPDPRSAAEIARADAEADRAMERDEAMVRAASERAQRVAQIASVRAQAAAERARQAAERDADFASAQAEAQAERAAAQGQAIAERAQRDAEREVERAQRLAEREAERGQREAERARREAERAAESGNRYIILADAPLN